MKLKNTIIKNIYYKFKFKNKNNKKILLFYRYKK